MNSYRDLPENFKLIDDEILFLKKETEEMKVVNGEYWEYESDSTRFEKGKETLQVVHDKLVKLIDKIEKANKSPFII